MRSATVTVKTGSGLESRINERDTAGCRANQRSSPSAARNTRLKPTGPNGWAWLIWMIWPASTRASRGARVAPRWAKASAVAVTATRNAHEPVRLTKGRHAANYAVRVHVLGQRGHKPPGFGRLIQRLANDPAEEDALNSVEHGVVHEPDERRPPRDPRP